MTNIHKENPYRWCFTITELTKGPNVVNFSPIFWLGAQASAARGEGVSGTGWGREYPGSEISSAQSRDVFNSELRFQAYGVKTSSV